MQAVDTCNLDSFERLALADCPGVAAAGANSFAGELGT